MLLFKLLLLVASFLSVQLARAAEPQHHFGIEVVDDQTGRGVPLIEISTVSHTKYWTDSAGLVAIDDPSLLNQKVFVTLKGHGYEFKADGFGFHGTPLQFTPGKVALLKVKRINIAERLYRTTGEGIYRDSVLLGRETPLREPLLNGQVSGQDSVQSALYRGKIHWFWGDTARPAYPLGQFWTSGATSELPGRGGLDPAVGVDLTYYVDDTGFSRPMVAREKVPAKWLEALLTVKDDAGRERMLGRMARIKKLGETLGYDLVAFNDDKAIFESIAKLPLDSELTPVGQAFRASDGYYYFLHDFPDVRTKATWHSITTLSDYEGFTCLADGTRFEREESKLDRDRQGKLRWSWKKNTEPLSRKELDTLVKAGKITAADIWFQPRDAQTKEPVEIASPSVEYNDYRKRWIMIGGQRGGKTSFLGEIWYGEADSPEGPWPRLRKIVTHDRYSFYNPRHHKFFDQDGGRLIYFEGTYTGMFSREHDLTPRYEYNQIMYRLDLGDERLKFPE